MAAAICAALSQQGERVAAFKPAVTGLDEPASGDWPPDHELLASTANAGQRPEDVAPYRFGPAASPHYAAEVAGAPIDPARLVAHARETATGADALVCEGVGGLAVPLTAGYLVRDLAADLGLPTVIVARPGLGTINHTLLTAEAATARGLDVAGVVLSPWPADPSGLELSNVATFEALAGVPVSRFSHVSSTDLPRAGDLLPLHLWLDGLGPTAR